MSFSDLRSIDLKNINSFKNELSKLNTRQEIISHSLKRIKGFFPIDFVGWNHMDGEKPFFLDAQIYPAIPENVAHSIFDPMSELVGTNHSIDHFYNIPTSSLSVKPMNEFVHDIKFKASPIYNEVYKHFDAYRQVYCHIPGDEASRVFFILTRKSVKFNSRENQLLLCLGNLIHERISKLNKIISPLTLMNQLYEAFDSETESLVRLSHNLQIIEAGHSTTSLFQTFFPHYHRGNTLPEPILKWMNFEMNRSGIQNMGMSIKKTTVFQRWGRNLIVIWFKKPTDKESILTIQEDLVAKQNYLDDIGKLTRKQRIIYHLIKDGVKDTNELAQRLDLSVRTIEGHRTNLKRILETKMT